MKYIVKVNGEVVESFNDKKKAYKYAEKLNSKSELFYYVVECK